MEVVIQPDAEHVAETAFGVIRRLLATKPTAVLGLATGSSPLGLYQKLVAACAVGEVSFARSEAFMLDEYLGLPRAHPQSYRHFLRQHLCDAVNMAALHGPDPLCTDPEAEAARYESAIADRGGIDLQLLGIGSDGHIGFNEPSSSLSSRTRVKTLTHQTRHDNARFFGDDIDAVPRHVLTQGIGTILDARHLMLIATGATKAVPIAKAVEGPLSAMVPASALQLHPRATIIVDEAAASQLMLADYYRSTYANKPDWQQL